VCGRRSTPGSSQRIAGRRRERLSQTIDHVDALRYVIDERYVAEPE
jgi:hypothetical protein